MAKRNLLNIRELVGGVGNQLRYVDRFATCRRNHKENVAEHQFYTAFFTYMISLHVGGDVSIGEAVTKALIHDIEEHYTGDVVRPVKHGNKAIDEGFKKTGEEFTRTFFETMTSNREISELLYMTWFSSKDATMEGRIVKFADYLSVLAYLDQEIHSGNYLVLQNVMHLRQYSEVFNGDDFEFIRDFVNESKELVRDIIKIATARREGK